MITDTEAADWGGLDENDLDPVVGLAARLLADRKRYCEFITWASAEWPKHMAAEEVLAKIRTKARALRKEARG